MKPRSLLLAPGAGADRTSAALVAIDNAVSDLGIVVSRMDFPYRKAGRRAPDRQPVLVQAVREEAELLVASSGGRPKSLLLGGRSMGGRMCSIAVAEGLPAAGLVLVSYPLHPPGKPDMLRTSHFSEINVPCLFVSGTRDSFAKPEELLAATQLLGGKVTHHWIEGGDHGLAKHHDEVAEIVKTWVRTLR